MSLIDCCSFFFFFFNQVVCRAWYCFFSLFLDDGKVLWFLASFRVTGDVDRSFSNTLTESKFYFLSYGVGVILRCYLCDELSVVTGLRFGCFLVLGSVVLS